MKSSDPSRERRITWWLFGATLAICASLLVDSLDWSFGYDQGTFAYAGAAILKGQRLYLDLWDIKPPNIFYLYAGAFALFGNSEFAIRLLDYLNALGTVTLIWFTTLRLFGTFGAQYVRRNWWAQLAAMFAALAFVLSYLIQGFQDTAQPETYALPLLLGSMLLVLRKSPSRKSGLAIAMSGGLIGFATFFKFPFGLFILLPAVCLMVQISGKERLRAVLLMVAGFMVAVALEILILLPGNELKELIRITRDATLAYRQTNYSGSFSLLHNLRTASQMFVMFWLVLGGVGVLALLLGAGQVMRRLLRLPMGLLVLATIVGLIVVQAQNKGYTYHYQIILPWVAILIGVGLATLALGMYNRIATLSISTSGVIRYGLLSVFVVCFIASTLWSGARAFKDSLTPSEVDRTSTQYVAGERLTNYVLTHTSPNDRIFIFGFQPYVYWKTGRQPANRFLNTIHFKPTYVAPELQIELVTSLVQHPPRYLFVETGDHYTSQGDSFDDSRTTIHKRYPAIEQLLASRYSVPDTVGDILAYYLRQ